MEFKVPPFVASLIYRQGLRRIEDEEPEFPPRRLRSCAGAGAAGNNFGTATYGLHS